MTKIDNTVLDLNAIEARARAAGDRGPWSLTKCDDGLWMVHTQGDTVCFSDPNHHEPDDELPLTHIAGMDPQTTLALVALARRGAHRRQVMTEQESDEDFIYRILGSSKNYGDTDNWLKLVVGDFTRLAELLRRAIVSSDSTTAVSFVRDNTILADTKCTEEHALKIIHGVLARVSPGHRAGLMRGAEIADSMRKEWRDTRPIVGPPAPVPPAEVAELCQDCGCQHLDDDSCPSPEIEMDRCRAIAAARQQGVAEGMERAAQIADIKFGAPPPQVAGARRAIAATIRSAAGALTAAQPSAGACKHVWADDEGTSAVCERCGMSHDQFVARQSRADAGEVTEEMFEAAKTAWLRQEKGIARRTSDDCLLAALRSALATATREIRFLAEAGTQRLQDHGIQVDSPGHRQASGLVCPFCGETDFDEEGLSMHLFRWCEKGRHPASDFRFDQLRDLAEAAESERDARADFMRRRGYRGCNTPACNCNSWHGGHAADRLSEIRDIIDSEGGFNGVTTIDAVRRLFDRATTAESRLAELAAELETLRRENHPK